MIRPEFIDRLKAQVDIVTLIRQYIELDKRGSAYKGKCPFHNENSASFSVNPTRQSYKCFGCGAGGDAIKFVMEHQKQTYPEAIQTIANHLNLTVEYDTPARPKSRFSGQHLR